MKRDTYTFNVVFSDNKHKQNICHLLDDEKMEYTTPRKDAISFTTGEFELGKYMKKIEQVCGDPDYLMDLDAIWNYKSANEIRLSGIANQPG